MDPAVATNTYHSAYTYPTPLSWMLGQRAYVCAVWNQDLSPLTGSVLLAQTRLDAVSQTVLGASAPAVHYPDFASVDGLALIGSTHQDGEAVALTAFAEHVQRDAPFQTERLQRGAMWYDEEVPVANGFETVFAFQLEQYSWFTIGDGFAFVIQNHSAHAFGGDIGYQHIPNSVAVEFDSFRQASRGDPKAAISEAPDLLANHVSVHTKGVGSNDTHIAASLGWAGLEPVVLADRAAHVVLIRYVPGEMTIYVDQFESPVLTVDIDLAKILDLDAGAAYLGFTASSGPRITGHKILGWELATTTTP